MTGPPSPDRARSALLELLRRRGGLAFPGREELAWSALERAARAARLEPGPYLDRLLAGDAPLDRLLDEATVRETYFLRDPAQWRFIERVVLPDALRAWSPGPRADARRERTGGAGAAGTAPAPFRAWSAGCATGEEPYTLAALLLEGGLILI